jgi:hypothetical protein
MEVESKAYQKLKAKVRNIQPENRMFLLPEPKAHELISEIDKRRVLFEDETARLAADFQAALAAFQLEEVSKRRK